MTQIKYDTSSKEQLVGAGTIWSFWDGNPSDLVMRCIQSMKANNPSRPIIVVNKKTIHKYLEPSDFPMFKGGFRGTADSFSCVQYLSDWVRLTLLEKYGGVWLDASIICTSSVNDWIQDTTRITMFPMHANPNVHGNWAIGCPTPHHSVIRAWRSELAKIYSDIEPGEIPHEYIEQAFQDYPPLIKLWNKPASPPLPYLWPYLALQVVLQKHFELHDTISLLPSNTGPMYRRYLFNPDGSPDDTLSQKTAIHLATKPLRIDTHDRWFIKLVGKDREPVQNMLDAGLYVPGSALHKLSRFAPRPIEHGTDLTHNPVEESEEEVDALCKWAAVCYHQAAASVTEFPFIKQQASERSMSVVAA